ncbi:MAG: HEPN domain-containing protein [Phycisphaerales bacterium]|nr:HEPN domain-containing protein [Phycisphaerales bacterium]
MPDRAGDWLEQAERDIAQARDSAAAGRHEWACFAAPQAAEMAVKALHPKLGQDAWGHVVRRLLEELPAAHPATPERIECARVLDGYHIPTRNPNGHAAGAPGEHYGPSQSTEAIRHAGQIIQFCRAEMAKA